MPTNSLPPAHQMTVTAPAGSSVTVWRLPDTPGGLSPGTPPVTVAAGSTGYFGPYPEARQFQFSDGATLTVARADATPPRWMLNPVPTGYVVDIPSGQHTLYASPLTVEGTLTIDGTASVVL